MRWWNRTSARLFDRLSERRLAQERALVELGHDHERKVWLRVVGTFVLSLAVMLGEDWAPMPLDLVASVVLGYLLGTAAFGSAGRAFAYRSGWLDGRRRMVEQMQAHQERGSTPHDWLETELNFDTVNVLGLPPVMPPRGGRHE